MLQTMNDINANITRLNIERLRLIGENDVYELRALPYEQKSLKPMQSDISQSMHQRINDIFRKILSLFKISKISDYSMQENFLIFLKEIVISFPSYTKERMNEDIHKLYEQTKNMLEKEAQGILIDSLISCKEAIFKD